MSKTVITYGTFDLFHIGHLRILERLRALGDRLIVGISTDEFNLLKGKKTIVPFSDRSAIVAGLRYVDETFPEESWDQKVEDIRRFGADIFGMGSDWAGRFDDLRAHCEVVYLDRTASISSTDVKRLLRILNQQHVQDLKTALDLISTIVATFDS